MHARGEGGRQIPLSLQYLPGGPSTQQVARTWQGLVESGKCFQGVANSRGSRCCQGLPGNALMHPWAGRARPPPLLGIYLVSQVHNKSPVDAKAWWSLADLSKSPQGYRFQGLQGLPAECARKQLNVPTMGRRFPCSYSTWGSQFRGLPGIARIWQEAHKCTHRAGGGDNPALCG
jgi:hypothetical protein